VTALVVATGLAVHRLFREAAGPQGDKLCPPLEPSESAPLPPLDAESTQPYGTLRWQQQGGTLDDASCVDRTSVYGVVAVQTEDDVREALLFARERGLQVSLAGVRHSMGGQAFARGNLVLDVRGLNAITVHSAERRVTVGAGVTWHDLQLKLHPLLAVKAMQSTDIFTVGGSISVNAHGMDHQAGALERSIRQLRVMLPDGTVRTISRTQDADLYRHVVGGYGLFGIILEAELDVAENVIYQSQRHRLPTRDFPRFFAEDIAPRRDIGLMYAHLSTARQNLLEEALVYTYEWARPASPSAPPLQDVGSVALRRLTVNLAKRGWAWQQIKWWSELYLEPTLESCTVSRQGAQRSGEACLVARNEPMHDSVPYLKNPLTNETDILHEYFLPRAQLLPFLEALRRLTLAQTELSLLNASVRVVDREDIALSYAPAEAFSVVLYVNQPTTPAGHEAMRAYTQALIDVTTKLGGRFFLPYQRHYTATQLRAAYPEIDAFFAAKRRLDPDDLLTNTWYRTYAPPQAG
jgi:FAD/FMN-containing dehydrogenase